MGDFTLVTRGRPVSTKWRTPSGLYEGLNKVVGGFAVDAAADETDHLSEVWYGPGGIHEDALEVPVWASPSFCNPPYLSGKAWEQWLEKFVEQAGLGMDIVALLPAKTGTEWWYKYVVMPRCNIFFLKGRVPFELSGMTKPSAPNHDSAVVHYGSQSSGMVTWIDWKPKLVPVEKGSNAPAVETAELSRVPPTAPEPRVHEAEFSEQPASLPRGSGRRGSRGA